jgi:hypothetical protein
VDKASVSLRAFQRLLGWKHSQQATDSNGDIHV